MPKVSIGLPVYNGDLYIEEAIESILNQTYKNIELIICDNASNDRTEIICNRYAKKDKRIFYHRQKHNYGAAKNYNDTFMFASGKYFKWISHDDICENSFIAKCVNILEQDTNIALCYPKTVLIDDNGNTIRSYEDNLHLVTDKPFKRIYKFEKNIYLCNAVFGVIRSDILKQTGLIGKYIGSDEVLLFELCLLGKIYELNERLFFRRDKKNNVRKLSRKEMAKWFDTRYRRIIHKFPLAYLTYKKIIAIRNSQSSSIEKVFCYPALSIRAWINCKSIGRRYIRMLKRILMVS